MKILALDPGTTKTGWCLLRSGSPISFGIEENQDMLRLIRNSSHADHLAIEMIASYGMAVGREVFETCVWFEANWLKTGQKNFRLPAPIFAQTNYCYGGPSRQEMAVMAHDEIMRLLEVEAVRDPISRAMHVRVMFDDIAMGYALSDSALHAMPEEVLAEKMVNELFPLLKDAIRQLKGNR